MGIKPKEVDPFRHRTASFSIDDELRRSWNSNVWFRYGGRNWWI